MSTKDDEIKMHEDQRDAGSCSFQKVGLLRHQVATLSQCKSHSEHSKSGSSLHRKIGLGFTCQCVMM